MWYETPKSKELITSSKSNTSFTFAEEQCSGLFFIINENRANVHWNQPDNFRFSSDFWKSKIININCIGYKLSKHFTNTQKLPNVCDLCNFFSTGSSSGIEDISCATDRLKNVPCPTFENITLYTSMCFFNRSVTSLILK